jgi:hypothetical protein
VFSMVSGPRLYNESLSVALGSPVVQLERGCLGEDDSGQSPVNCYNLLCKDPINSIIKCKAVY